MRYTEFHSTHRVIAENAGEAEAPRSEQYCAWILYISTLSRAVVIDS